MIVCTRFEDEGLLALERGEALDEHFSECKECIEAQRVYRVLKSQLKGLGEGEQLTDDWQNHVLESIAKSKSEPNSQTMAQPGHTDEVRNVEFFKAPMLKIAASFAVVAIVVLLLTSLNKIPQESAQLVATVVKSDINYRGGNAKVGDSLELSFNGVEGQHSEIRVYLDSKIYYQCKLDRVNAHDSVGCVVTMKAIGEYQSVLIVNDQQADIPAEKFDADILFARDSGLSVLLSEKVVVQ